VDVAGSLICLALPATAGSDILAATVAKHGCDLHVLSIQRQKYFDLGQTISEKIFIHGKSNLLTARHIMTGQINPL
jgi:hypothetical protein